MKHGIMPLIRFSGIHKTTTLDTTDCYADLAAEVKCDTLGDFEGSEDADRSAQLCIKAAGEAMKDADLMICRRS